MTYYVCNVLTILCSPIGRQASTLSFLAMRRLRARMRWVMRQRNLVGTSPDTCSIFYSNLGLEWWWGASEIYELWNKSYIYLAQSYIYILLCSSVRYNSLLAKRLPLLGALILTRRISTTELWPNSPLHKVPLVAWTAFVGLSDLVSTDSSSFLYWNDLLFHRYIW